MKNVWARCVLVLYTFLSMFCWLMLLLFMVLILSTVFIFFICVVFAFKTPKKVKITQANIFFFRFSNCWAVFLRRWLMNGGFLFRMVCYYMALQSARGRPIRKRLRRLCWMMCRWMRERKYRCVKLCPFRRNETTEKSLME